MEPADHSSHPTIVEYAVRELFKNKSPIAAARATKRKLHGGVNFFVDAHHPVNIDETRLASALVTRMAEFAIQALRHVRPGAESYALDGAVQHFHQKPALGPVIRERAVEILGRDPFAPPGT